MPQEQNQFTTTFDNAVNSAGIVIVNGCEADDDFFRYYTEDGIDYISINMTDFDQGVLIFEAKQEITVDDNGAKVMDTSGKEHAVLFNVTKPMRAEDLVKV